MFVRRFHTSRSAWVIFIGEPSIKPQLIEFHQVELQSVRQESAWLARLGRNRRQARYKQTLGRPINCRRVLRTAAFLLYPTNDALFAFSVHRQLALRHVPRHKLRR